MNFDALQKAIPSMAKDSPFPYLVIDDALPADVYQRLADSYPDGRKMASDRKNLNNARFNLISRWGKTEFPYEDASDDWQKFVETNESESFVSKVYSLFPEFMKSSNTKEIIDLEKYGPDLANKLKIDPSVATSDVIPRVTVAVNTPVLEQSSVRGAHTDNMRKAYVALMYFRDPADDSSGGDLEVFKWKDGVPRTEWVVEAPRDQVEVVETIAYKPNRLILFLCTSDALHGVSPRSVTPHWRHLIVISGWFPGVEYADTDTFERGFKSLMMRVRRKARSVLGS